MLPIPNSSMIKFQEDEVPLIFEVWPFEGRGDYDYDEF